MPRYIVNRNAQPNGDHEVHIDNGSCNNMPDPQNRVDLGVHADCHGAVRKAKEKFRQSNGCKHCSPNCHTS